MRIVDAVKQVTLHGSGYGPNWVAYLPLDRAKAAINDRDTEAKVSARCRAIMDGLPPGIRKRELLAGI